MAYLEWPWPDSGLNILRLTQRHALRIAPYGFLNANKTTTYMGMCNRGVISDRILPDNIVLPRINRGREKFFRAFPVRPPPPAWVPLREDYRYGIKPSERQLQN